MKKEAPSSLSALWSDKKNRHHHPFEFFRKELKSASHPKVQITQLSNYTVYIIVPGNTNHHTQKNLIRLFTELMIK